MNEHMLKALKADRHPQIEFDLTTYDLVRSATNLGVRLTGPLTMGGTTREVAIDGVVTDAGNGVLRIAGAYPVVMSEFGLRRPSLMMGTIKVGDEIVVHFDLLLSGRRYTDD
jgi:polyisoprenoid-binding protein YceI